MFTLRRISRESKKKDEKEKDNKGSRIKLLKVNLHNRSMGKILLTPH